MGYTREALAEAMKKAEERGKACFVQMLIGGLEKEEMKWAISWQKQQNDLCASEDSDQPGQADLSLCWAHISVCWFCREVAQIEVQIYFLENISSPYICLAIMFWLAILFW